MTPAELRAKLAKTEPSVLVEFLVRLAGEGGALGERIETLAERYVDRSAALDSAVRDERVLQAHARYVAQLREQHPRKASFWKLFAARGSQLGSD